MKFVLTKMEAAAIRE